MSDMDWKIWAWKGVKRIGLACAVVACTEGASYIEVTQHEIPMEYVAYATLGIVLLQQIGNWIKHTWLVD